MRVNVYQVIQLLVNALVISFRQQHKFSGLETELNPRKRTDKSY